MAERHLQPGDLAPDVTVLDLEGKPVELGRVWPQGPTLLALVRHYG